MSKTSTRLIRTYSQKTMRAIGVFGFVAFLYIATSALTIERRAVDGILESSWVTHSFYNTTPITTQTPGVLVRSEKLASAPNGMNGWRIVYTSTDHTGKIIWTSGLVVAPSTSSNQKRDIIAWGHPTTGIAQRCAPSVGTDPFDLIEGLRSFIQAGYVVVAPDYSGMGMDGPPSFLIGETEGRNMLDAARAAQHIPASQAGRTLALWGHSQGGHAALFAAEIASTYAPEFDLRGVATAAPATELGALLQDDIGDISGVTIGAYAFSSYSAAYGLPLSNILTPQGTAATPKMADLCLIGQNNQIHAIARPLIGNYIAHNPIDTPPWSDALTRNTPGRSKIPVQLFVAQGDIDTLIKPSITKDFAQRQQNLGANVTYHSIPNTGHGMVALRAVPQLMDWLKTLQ